jgi:hypothetical protein
VLLNPDSLKSNTGLVGVRKCPLARLTAPLPDHETAAIASSGDSSGGSSIVFGDRAGGSKRRTTTLPQHPSTRADSPILPVARLGSQDLDPVSESSSVRGSTASDRSAREPSRRRRVRLNSGGRGGSGGRRPASSVEAEQDGSDGVALSRDDGSGGHSASESGSADESVPRNALRWAGIARGQARKFTPAHRLPTRTKSALRAPVPANAADDGVGRRGSGDEPEDKAVPRGPAGGLSIKGATWERGDAEEGAPRSDSSDDLLHPGRRVGSIRTAPSRAKGERPPPQPPPLFPTACALCSRCCISPPACRASSA